MNLIGSARAATPSSLWTVRALQIPAGSLGVPGEVGDARDPGGHASRQATTARAHHAAAITSSMSDAVSVQSLTARVGMPSASTG